jgi:hypothetical protein
VLAVNRRDAPVYFGSRVPGRGLGTVMLSLGDPTATGAAPPGPPVILFGLSGLAGAAPAVQWMQ